MNDSKPGYLGRYVRPAPMDRNNIGLCTQRKFCRHILQSCAFTFGKLVFVSTAMSFFMAHEIHFTFTVLPSEKSHDSQQSEILGCKLEKYTVLTDNFPFVLL